MLSYCFIATSTGLFANIKHAKAMSDLKDPSTKLNSILTQI